MKVFTTLYILTLISVLIAEPTEKMPRMLFSSPSATRKLMKKAQLLGIHTQVFIYEPLLLFYTLLALIDQRVSFSK